MYLLPKTGEGLDNFWKVLVNGRNCSVPIPKERFDLSSWYDPDDNKPGKSRTAKAALIDGYGPLSHLDLLICFTNVRLSIQSYKLLFGNFTQ